MIKNPNVKGIIIALTIIALAGIAIVVAAPSLLVQSASDINAMANTSLDGEKETANSTTATNNVSNDPLGRLFMIVEFEETNVNPINATYIETSTVNNVTLILPDGNATITATEIANVTVTILPNGLAIDKGQSHIVIEGDDGAEQEIATTTFVDLARLNPDGSGSGTGIVFFSTNSTGRLAFLDGMVGINDSEFAPGEGTIRVWEWKGETMPFENSGAPTTGN
jgi:hypothetical protein